MQVDLESARSQRALAEAVVRNMDTRDLVAVASGRLGADALAAAAAERSRDRSSRSSESDEPRGINQVRSGDLSDGKVQRRVQVRACLNLKFTIVQIVNRVDVGR